MLVIVDPFGSLLDFKASFVCGSVVEICKSLGLPDSPCLWCDILVSHIY